MSRLTSSTWLGAAALVSVIALGLLVWQDKPVDATFLPIVAALVAALVHQSGGTQGATAALATPAEAVVPPAVSSDLSNIRGRLQQLEASRPRLPQAPGSGVMQGPSGVSSQPPAPANVPVSPTVAPGPPVA